ncbi:MAG TPA: hypothetical protein VFE32_21980 [Puia sp.]|jgi:hypothetical protein|nr:hypothetical protein [Puia sp.]
MLTLKAITEGAPERPETPDPEVAGDLNEKANDNPDINEWGKRYGPNDSYWLKESDWSVDTDEHGHVKDTVKWNGAKQTFDTSWTVRKKNN